MAEELKKEDPKAEVRRRQIEIAKSMKVKPEILSVLEKVEEWQNREWLYICALDGMNVEQIRAMQEKKATTGQIRKARLEYLREYLMQTDLFQIRLEKLQKEVQEVCQESREARDAIERGLEDALKKQALAQAETIRAKDQMIEMLNRQNEELRHQVQELKQQAERKIRYPDDQSVQVNHKRNSRPVMMENPNAEEAGTDERRSLPISNSVISDNGKSQETEQSVQREKSSLIGHLLSFRKDSDVKRFIELYIKNDDIAPDQKEFLLDCLEEGMSVKDIEKFAAPGLSVEVMKRLKKLQTKK